LFGGWMFRRQIDALRDDYRCIAIDWRGQGKSPRARAGYDMDTLSHDAVGLIDSLGTAPVHWVGLSMGGFVGMRIAARRPSSIRSLVLLNTSADREPLRSAVQDLLLAQLYRWAGIAPLQRQVENILFGAAFRNAPDGRRVIDEWAMKLAENDRRGMAEAVIGVLTRKAVSHELCRITAPTLVIAGEQDKAIPVLRGRRIAQAIAGARFELVPLAGHSSTLEQPAIVTALIRNFLAEH
jgi:pimeloyl-ACP methyl ester carboxylesterase